MTDQPVREGSSGQSGAANVASAANMMPPPGPSAPLASGKPAGTRRGFSNQLGLAGALLAVVPDTYRRRRKRA